MIYNDSCCFTGHRIIAEGALNNVLIGLYRTVVELYGRGIRYFICGGARGFDMYAAQTVMKLKRQYEDISLVMALPCRDQDALWNRREREDFAQIIAGADLIYYVSGDEYKKGCMQRRNIWMAEHARVCVYYKERDFGGTAFTVQYAGKRGCELFDVLSFEDTPCSM